MVTLLGFLLWDKVSNIQDDLSEVKADVKTLMANYNVDHTRIDGLERQVFKLDPKPYTSNAPIPADEPELIKRVAIIPKDEFASVKW